MENIEPIKKENYSSVRKEGLDFTEKEIAKMLMESPFYETLKPHERLDLVKFLKEKYPALAKEFDPEHFDA
ncbi:hypothetical protein KKD04_00265 [Patescibacteria group bacterium]|nr:hypothetical protein [Patescibacteria group bacterium]